MRSRTHQEKRHGQAGWRVLSPLCLLLLGAAEAPIPSAPLPPAEAARQGRALAAELISQKPSQNLTNNGVLKIRDAQKARREIPVTFTTMTGTGQWTAVYQAGAVGTNMGVTLAVTHVEGQPNSCVLTRNNQQWTLAGNDTMVPFAGSDFCVADLALNFFHWPEQRLLKSEMRHSRSCRVLESVNPKPEPRDYSKVRSWIDLETDGVVHAEAYDFKGELLKEFDPKGFKKVRGQWELQEMEIDNRQTGSRSRIEFNGN